MCLHGDGDGCGEMAGMGGGLYGSVFWIEVESGRIYGLLFGVVAGLFSWDVLGKEV